MEHSTQVYIHSPVPVLATRRQYSCSEPGTWGFLQSQMKANLASMNLKSARFTPTISGSFSPRPITPTRTTNRFPLTSPPAFLRTPPTLSASRPIPLCSLPDGASNLPAVSNSSSPHLSASAYTWPGRRVRQIPYTRISPEPKSSRPPSIGLPSQAMGVPFRSRIGWWLPGLFAWWEHATHAQYCNTSDK